MLIKSFIIVNAVLCFHCCAAFYKTFRPVRNYRLFVDTIKTKFETRKDWIVEHSVSEISISYYLMQFTDNYFSSSTAMKNAIRRGLIHVNGKSVKIDYKIKNKDYIEHVVRSQVDIATEYQKILPTLSNNTKDEFGSSNSTANKIDLSIEKEKSVFIVYEDDHLAIVHKPQGMPVYNTLSSPSSITLSSNTTTSGLFTTSLHTEILKILSSGASGIDSQPLRRPQPVHRLDQGTGGLVVIAKTHVSLTKLTELFSTRQVHKQYRAIVSGRVKIDINSQSIHGQSQYTSYKTENTNSTYMYNNDNTSLKSNNITDVNSYTMVDTKNNSDDNDRSKGSIHWKIDGKDSYTEYEIVEYTTIQTHSISTQHSDSDLSYNCTSTPITTLNEDLRNESQTHNDLINHTITTLNVYPHTGRKHQIRIHMDVLGHPILGDPDYWYTRGRKMSNIYATKRNTPYPQLKKVSPICLYAIGITFPHPIFINHTVSVHLPEPQSFIQLRQSLQAYKGCLSPSP